MAYRFTFTPEIVRFIGEITAVVYRLSFGFQWR
jgi:hypothetical protein